MTPYTLHQGDCRDVMAGMDADSVDAIVCDPPYGLRFMGKGWDHGVPGVEFWQAAKRVAKPGAHLLAFGGTRTFHRLTVAIEDAGWEIRDCVMWVYGSGFPKSLDVSKAIDTRGGADIGWFGPWLRAERKRRGIPQKDLAAHFPSASGGLTGCVANWELGLNLPTVEQFNTLCAVLSLPFARIEEAEREIVGRNNRPAGWFTSGEGHDITAPATPEAQQWQGWGTALKPAWEPVIVARKPLAGTVASNVLRYGTGGINVDATRISGDEFARTGGGSSGNSDRGREDGPQTYTPSIALRAFAAEQRDPHSARLASDLADAFGRAPVQDSLGDCLSCPRCDDGRARIAQAVALLPPPSQLDALGALPDREWSASHIRSNRCADHLSIWDDLALVVSDSYGNYTRKVDAPPTQRNRAMVRETPAPFGKNYEMDGDGSPLGRWPANLIHDGSEDVVGLFPAEAGAGGRASGPTLVGGNDSRARGHFNGTDREPPFHGDSGSAARFFYTAKASREDREEGLESLPLRTAGEATARNHHPTVKPTSLMRYLCRLVTPPGGVVLDPFMGSGSTGKAAILEGFGFVGIDLEEEYMEIARARCEWALAQPRQEPLPLVIEPPAEQGAMPL